MAYAIHHSASGTEACSSSAIAIAKGDMRAKRDAEALAAWATKGSIVACAVSPRPAMP
jgi:hypothetical protein